MWAVEVGLFNELQQVLDVARCVVRKGLFTTVAPAVGVAPAAAASPAATSATVATTVAPKACTAATAQGGVVVY